MTAAAKTTTAIGGGDQAPGPLLGDDVGTGRVRPLPRARLPCRRPAPRACRPCCVDGRAVLGQCLSSMLGCGRGRPVRPPSLGRHLGRPGRRAGPGCRGSGSVRSCGDTRAAQDVVRAAVRRPSTGRARRRRAGRGRRRAARRTASTATTRPTSRCSWPSRPAGRRARSPRPSPTELRAAAGVAAVDVAGPGFLNITLDAAAQGELAAPSVDRGRRLRAHRGPGRAAAQPGVRLGQPDRAGAHRRHVRWAAVGDALGRLLHGQRRRGHPGVLLQRRRRADRPVRRVSCWPRRRASRCPRTATAAPTSARSPPRSSPPSPAVLDLPDDEAAGGVPRARASTLMFAEIRRSLADFGVRLRRLLQREGPARERRAGQGARPGCASRATSTRPTARSGCGRPTSATTRTGCWSRATASRPTSPPTAPTTWTSASAASTRS